MSASGVGVAPSPWVRRTILVVVGLLFLLPIASMIEFTLRAGLVGGYDLHNWAAILDPENERRYRVLFEGVTNSILLAVATVAIILVLLVPTVVLVTVRFPRLRRVLEFVCIVPITVPAIVAVVGLAPVYSVLSRVFGSSPWTLAFAYGVIVLPYAYRAIAADLAGIDAVTLAEAARSLGAGPASILFRVILPNLRRGILAASFLTVAVVLGEYTIASLLNRSNLQTSLVQMSRSDAAAAVIFALLALGFVLVLLLLIGRIAEIGRPSRKNQIS